MTGAQSAAVNEQNQAAAMLNGALPKTWSGAAEIRAGISAIPAEKRMEALAALRALLSGETSDTKAGAFIA